MIQNCLITENIPVDLSFKLKLKEIVHNFFRRPMVVSLLTYFPDFLFKNKALAQAILKCHDIFNAQPQLTAQMQIKIYGGDKLSTLSDLENQIANQPNPARYNTVFTFEKKTTLDVAHEMRQDPEARIALLNMANRWQPGGVALAPYGGSQEEALARASNLAWGLDARFASEQVHAKMAEMRQREGFGNEHFDHHIPYFGAVVSKDVTFIDQDDYQQFDVISAAAPDMRAGSDERRVIESFGDRKATARREIIENKVKGILSAAVEENRTHLVLGAFGCGCFGNDDQEVAEAFKKELKNNPLYQNRFKQVTFAMTSQTKLSIFRRIFNT